MSYQNVIGKYLYKAAIRQMPSLARQSTGKVFVILVTYQIAKFQYIEQLERFEVYGGCMMLMQEIRLLGGK